MNVIDSTDAVLCTENTLVSDIVEEGNALCEVRESPSFDLKLTASELDNLLTTLKIHAPDLLFTVISQLENQFDTNDSISYPMSYSQFKLAHVRQKFNLKTADAHLFDLDKLSIIPKKELQDLEVYLKKNKLVAWKSEKALSEAIVFPIFIDLVERNKEYVHFFSGESFDVDKAQGLSGICDFLLSGQELSHLEVSVPVLAMVEAKKADIEEGLGQCAAEMVAARLFNQRNESGVETIYGVVTSGKIWRFLKLEKNTIFIDKTDYYHSVHLQEIMTILQKIVDDYKAIL